MLLIIARYNVLWNAAERLVRFMGQYWNFVEVFRIRHLDAKCCCSLPRFSAVKDKDATETKQK